MMGRGQQGGGQQRPPMAPAVDLDSLRQRSEQPLTFVPEEPGFFCNDVQPTITADGGLVLEFRYVNPARMEASLPIRISLPIGAFAALAGAAPTIIDQSVERHKAVADKLGESLAAGRAAAARAAGQPGMGGQ